MELFTDLNDDSHQDFSVTNKTSSDISIMIGQYGDEADIFNFLTGSFSGANGEALFLPTPDSKPTKPLGGPLNFTVPAGKRYCVSQGPSIPGGMPDFGSVMVKWFSGGKNQQKQRVNFGASINGQQLNPPPLYFMADDGTFYTTVYGGVGDGKNSWTSGQINGITYDFFVHGGSAHGKFDVMESGILSSYYCFDILIRQR